MTEKKTKNNPAKVRLKSKTKHKKRQINKPVKKSSFVSGNKSRVFFMSLSAREWSLLLGWIVLLTLVFVGLFSSDKLTRIKLVVSPLWDQRKQVSMLTSTIISTNDTRAGEIMSDWWKKSGRIDESENQLLTFLNPEEEVYARLTLINKALEVQPSHSDLLLEKVLLLTKLYRFQEAELVLNQLIIIDPNSAYIDEVRQYMTDAKVSAKP